MWQKIKKGAIDVCDEIVSAGLAVATGSTGMRFESGQNALVIRSLTN